MAASDSDLTLGTCPTQPGVVVWTTTRALGVSPNGVPWLRRDEPIASTPTLPMRVQWDLDGWQVWPVLGVEQPPCRKEHGWLPVAVLHEPVAADDPITALTAADRDWLRAHGWAG